MPSRRDSRSSSAAAIPEPPEPGRDAEVVIERATEHGRPLLLAMAERDLALLLIQAGDVTAGKAAAHRARSSYQRLSARAEIDKLDDLLETA